MAGETAIGTQLELAREGLMEILRRGIAVKNRTGAVGMFAGGHDAGMMAAAAVAEQCLLEMQEAGGEPIDVEGYESDHGRSLEAGNG